MEVEFDDDFFGAECEMDDQMLILNDDDDDEDIANDDYDRQFHEAEMSIGHEDLTSEEYRSWKQSQMGKFVRDELLESECLTLKRRISKKRGSEASARVYPPERRPPIFDFFTVLTAFIVAVILAYYTISSY